MSFDKIEKLPPRKPRKYKKRTDQQKLIDANDDLFRNIIYKTYNKECQLGGKTSTQCKGNIQCAHIISRGNYRLRWDLKNAVCLCQAHHMYYTYREYLWWDIVEEQWPHLWEYVKPLKRTLGSKKVSDLKTMKLYLKQILTGME